MPPLATGAAECVAASGAGVADLAGRGPQHQGREDLWGLHVLGAHHGPHHAKLLHHRV